jgi:hypothetical protein
MDRAEKVVYVNGFGLMRVPAGLQGEDLEKYVSQEVDRSLSTPVEQAPVESKKDKSLGAIEQAGAFLGAIPEGIASGVGSTVSGLGALTTIDALKRAGAGVSEFGRDISKELLTPEQLESMGASGGRLVGNILTYLTPGVAVKAIGAAPRAALGISSLISGLGGAGEQLEKIEEQRKAGKQISPAEEFGLSALAGAGTAALETLPLGRFLGTPGAGRIPVVGRLLSEGLPKEVVEQVEKKYAGDAVKVAEELALKEAQRRATMGLPEYIGSAIRGGLTEAPVEGAQQVLQNVLARTYNPEQQITEGLKESLIGGGLAGSAIQGGIDIFQSMDAKKTVRKVAEEAKRQRTAPPELPETALQSTLFARAGEDRFVEGEAEKAERQGVEGAIEEIKRVAVPTTPLLPAAETKDVETELGVIQFPAAATPEEISQQVEEIKKLRLASEESNEAAKSYYQQAEQAKQAAANNELKEAKSFISQNKEAADTTAKELGFDSIKEVPDQDIPTFIDEMLGWMYKRQDQLSSASANIEGNFSVASDLARSEFKKPLGELNDTQKIKLSELVTTQVELNKQEYQDAAREAEMQTELNKVTEQYGENWPTPTGADSQTARQARVSQQLLSKPYEKLTEAEKVEVEGLATEPGVGVEVTPEEVLEKRQFEGKPFTTAEYRSVQDSLKANPDAPVTTSSLRSQFKLKPNVAVSMIDLMRKRGDIVEENKKLYVNDKAPGPLYEETAQPAAVEAPKVEPAQVQFNEQLARQYAPDLVAAMKKRNVEDLFVLGIAGKLRDPQGKVMPAKGQYLDRAIYVATTPEGNVRSVDDMIKTLDHEIIHGMKELNMFSQNEWNMMTAKFPVSYLGEDKEKVYRERYKGRPNLELLLREEAIAKAAADLSKVDPERLDPVGKSLVRKVKSFLGFGNTAAEMGYKSAEDVLAAIKSGEIGQRRYTPLREVTPAGKEISAQREISIAQAPKIKEAVQPPAPARVAPKAKPKKKKKAEKGKPEVQEEIDPMLSLGEAEEVGEQEEAAAPVQAGGVTRAFSGPKKDEGILNRILDFFSYDKRSSFRQKFLDRYDPVREWAEKAYEKTGDIKYKAAASGAYQALLFSDKSQEISMEGFLRGGFSTSDGVLRAVENKDHSPVEIFRKLAAIPASNEGFSNKLEEFFEAALARRSLDIYEQGRNPGGTLTRQQLESNWNSFKGDEDIADAMKNFKGYNDNLIDILVKSGVIDKKMAAQWKSAYYIPFYRLPTVKTAEGDEETGEVDIPRVGQNATNLAAAKALTGRKLAVNDAIENIIANTYFMIGTAMKNTAALRVVRDGLEMDYMKKIERPKDAEEGANVINVRRNGVKEYYQVDDPMVYDAVAKSGIPVQDALKMMGRFTQVLRKGVTLSPTFILKNPVRDTLQVWMQGDLGSDLIPPIGEMAKGISSVFSDSPEFQALKAAGIAGSGLKQNTIKETAEEIRKRIGLKQEGVINKLLGYLEKASEKSEAITRTQVYKDVLEKTGDEAEALFAAMETINFSRRGTSRGVQIAIALLPFFNARLQGLDVFYRRAIRGEKLAPTEITGDVRKRARQRMTYVAALSGIYAAAMAGNEAWQNATDEERDGNIFIPVDWVPGVEEGTALKFPIPQEFGIVTKMLPERLVSMYMGQSDGPELLDSMSRAVLSTLSFDPQPQVFRPWLEVAANFNFYTQKPIENAYLQRLFPEERYTEYTPEIYKQIGKATGVSPVKLEHLVRGYTGTLGAYTADVSSLLFGTGADSAAPERARLSQPYLLPVVGPLFRSSQGRRSVETLYEIQSVAEMAATTLKSVSKGQREISPERMEELQSMLYINKALQPALSRIQVLNRMKRTIQATSELSAAEKRDQLDEIQKEMISIAKPFKELKEQVPARYRAGLSRLLLGS